jgi:hypothetical protein
VAKVIIGKKSVIIFRLRPSGIFKKKNPTNIALIFYFLEYKSESKATNKLHSH